MFSQARSHFESELAGIEAAGLTKRERLITSPQAALITADGREVLNFCANNYLGLSSHPAVVAAAHAALDAQGYGLSSVRFICGTQAAHRELEREIAAYFGKDDCILYGSCFDANGGLFEVLVGEGDAIISDALNHASIIDGVRLCKAERHRYPSADMASLEKLLQATADKRFRLIATDGVFSMDGHLAPLDQICALAERHQAMVMVDDSHATGFVGPTGRGSAEYHGVLDRVDVITSTLGKALGGASGGFTVGPQPVIDLLRQRSRPYLFSNTVAPPIVGATREVLRLLSSTAELRERVMSNAARFRAGMTQAGFTLKPGFHPIVPVMLGDARLAATFADQLLGEGIYVIGFSFPVVPRGEARIRVQLSAAHTPEQVDRAVAAFTRVGRALGVVSGP